MLVSALIGRRLLVVSKRSLLTIALFLDAMLILPEARKIKLASD